MLSAFAFRRGHGRDEMQNMKRYNNAESSERTDFFMANIIIEKSKRILREKVEI